MRRSCASSSIARAVIVAFVALGSFAPVAVKGDERVQAGASLFLEVFINGDPTNLITRFTDLGDNALSADASELRNTGINPGANSGEVRLDQLPNLSWRIDHAKQVIFFEVAMEGRSSRIINASAEDINDDDAAPIDHGLGVVLNYDVSLDAAGAVGRSLDPLWAGLFDARVFSPIGSFNHSFSLTENTTGTITQRRLATYWRTAFPHRTLELQVGDLTTAGPNWARPVRLGGVTLRRNFGLRPDLVTIPLPEYVGSAAVPSTVEVYSGALRRYAADVPAGPFTLTDLPFPVGISDAQIVVRDVTGRETRVDVPFLVSSELLRPGVLDYALSVGAPRLGIGTSRDRYTDDTFASGSLRYGITPGLTLGAHLELGKDLMMGGVVVTFRIGHFGTATTSFAQSQSGDEEGLLVDAASEWKFGRARASGRVMRSRGEFADIASVSAAPDASGLASGRYTGLNQLTVGVPLDDPWGGYFSAFATSFDMMDGANDQSIGIAYTRPVFERGTFFVSALQAGGTSGDTSLRAGISLPLGPKTQATVSGERRSGEGNATASLSGRTGPDGNGWHWRAHAAAGVDTSLQASVGRDLPIASLELSGRRSESNQNLGLRVDGAVAIAGGGAFLSRRIDDAFAVIDAGAPDVTVFSENRAIGTTGQSGKLLVTGLRSYDDHTLRIDPMSLPIDADVPRTARVVRPAHRSGVSVDFGIDSATQSATVALVTADGQPVPVGVRARLNDAPEPFLVGYDGLVYAHGLLPANRLSVSLPDGAVCHATFSYENTPGVMDHISEVVCR